MNLKITAYYHIESILGNEFIVGKYINDCGYYFLASKYKGKNMMIKGFTKLLFARDKRDFNKIIKANKIVKFKKLNKQEAFLHLL